MGPDLGGESLLAPFSRCEANMQYCASSLAATWSLREIARKGIKDCKFQNAESREYILFMMLERIFCCRCQQGAIGSHRSLQAARGWNSAGFRCCAWV